MKMNTSCCFKFKLSNPYKKIVKLFKFKLKKPLFIRRLRFRPSRCESNTSTRKKQASQVLSMFRSIRRQPKEEDQVMELKSFSDADKGHIKAPVPSPITPAYVKFSGAFKNEVMIQDDVEDACRSFENYLAEMIVEEGKMRDLMDVEELLYCWKNLKSPVFIDLVCRFYGELCKDLFSNSYNDDISSLEKTLR